MDLFTFPRRSVKASEASHCELFHRSSWRATQKLILAGHCAGRTELSESAGVEGWQVAKGQQLKPVVTTGRPPCGMRASRHRNVKVWVGTRRLAHPLCLVTCCVVFYCKCRQFIEIYLAICFFWVIPRRLGSNSRRFGTLYRFHLHGQLDEEWLGMGRAAYLYLKGVW
jgi:hypothetical protein